MTLSTNIVVTAVVLLVVSGGLLFPVRSSINELEATIEQLEASENIGTDVPQQISELHEQLDAIRASSNDLDYSLCPDTPEARNELETALQREIRNAGLSRISMDRKAGFGLGTVPSFAIELVVEGDAFQLHSFLKGIESLEWVTRVLKLEIQPGDVERRIKMQIAVLLENNKS